MTGKQRLAEMQRRFGDAIRAPLDRGTGTLRAPVEAYDTALCASLAGDARERLAVYNRQYWFRLFGVFHQSYRLATALCGAWAMNELVARFLRAHPPTGHDLARAIDGFELWIQDELPETGVALGHTSALPRAALVEAMRIDDAYRLVFEAAAEPSLVLAPGDAARLERARLVPSRSAVMVEETWPLVQLRRGLPSTPAERWVALPPPHDNGTRDWLVCRVGEAHRVVPLAPLHARLLRLLRAHALPEALAILETGLPSSAVAEIAAHAQRWFAEGMQLGLWAALEEVA
ncbi:MAG TPA: putative DNA-binding domain-containing protein [Kofleriaceae bacterium]|nr:putative DNA-binding domain-containing protein [Kofleriaceae bacterium]